jgi:hypothetical protein
MDIFTELTPKQATFCAEYFKDFNATNAALRAGYSKATAMSGKLMAVPKIKQHLQERGAKFYERLAVNNEAILAELNKMAFASMGSFFDESGKVKPMHLVSEDVKASLLHYSFTEDRHGNTTIRIRMSNKLSALEKLTRLQNLCAPPKEVQYIVVDRERMDDDDRIDDDTIPKKEPVVEPDYAEEDVRRWIAEAREQAIYETEKRMRAEFAAREQGTKSKEQGQEVVGGVKGQAVGGDTDSGDGRMSPKSGVQSQEAAGRDGGMVGVNNTDFYLPTGGGNVVGPDSYRDTNNGGNKEEGQGNAAKKAGGGKIYPRLPVMGVSIGFNYGG